MNASGTLRTWDAPEGVAGNSTFRVRVREPGGPWRDLFVYNVRVGVWQHGGPFDSSMVHFDFTGTVTVEVTYGGTLDAFEFRPASFGIAARQAGDTLTFDITQDHDFPRKFVLRINDDWYSQCLHIFTNPPEADPPAPDEVDRYFGEGAVHDIGTLDIGQTTGKTIYIAGGAVVRGNIRADAATDLKIVGRGIFEGTIRSARDARNIKLQGFILTASSWAIVFDGGGHSGVAITNLALVTHGPTQRSCADGIHLDAAVECRCKGCFVRAGDDVLNVDARYGRRDMGRIVFENMVLWGDRSHCMMVGYKGTPENMETIHDVTFRNIDVIDNRGDAGWPLAVMQINGADNLTIRDICFEEIRIMPFQNPDRAQVLSIDMRMNHWSQPVNGLAVRNVTYRDITYTGDGEAPSQLIGKTPRRCVDGVRIVNYTRNGKPVACAEDANLLVNSHVRHLRFGASTAAIPPCVDFAPPDGFRETIPYAAAARATEPIRMNFHAPESVVAGLPFTVSDIRVFEESPVGGALRYRRKGERDSTAIPLEPTGEGRFCVTIPGEKTDQPFGYCIEVTCANGRTLREPAGETLVDVRPDAEPPSSVRDLEVTRIRRGGITLRWTPARDDTRIAGYEMFLRNAEGEETKVAELPPEELVFTCGTVAAGRELELGVRGFDCVRRTGGTKWIRARIPDTEDAPPLPDIHLSDLDAARATTGWGRVGRDRNGIRNPQPLRMRGIQYPKGLGVHADSELVYTLGPAHRRFVALVGIDDAQEGDARVLAKVFADDALLDQSPTLGKGDSPWPVDVAVPRGTRQLRLEIMDGYDNIPCGVTDWVNAGFLTE